MNASRMAAQVFRVSEPFVTELAHMAVREGWLMSLLVLVPLAGSVEDFITRKELTRITAFESFETPPLPLTGSTREDRRRLHIAEAGQRSVQALHVSGKIDCCAAIVLENDDTPVLACTWA
jgi:hypothetical protein